MPASSDAATVSRLRRQGFIILGRTNMTEFAFSGLGLNPHFGSPSNQLGDGKRIVGGSSSGAAVAVAQGTAHTGLGTDTGGSCRIPAAFNRLVGFKPTAHRVPLSGTIPLSPSLDSVGSIARLSMAEAKCARWRRKSVPVRFREKGCMSPCELRCRAH